MYTQEDPHGASGQIAVVGMAARLPGAPSVDDYWQLLLGGVDAIRPVPADRWDAAAPLDPDKEIQRVGGFLDDIDLFDPTFFGISPREAEDIDPQQRLFLETVWRALEDGGHRAADLRGTRAGVYAGTSWHDYEMLRKDRGFRATQHSQVGGALDVITSRVAYTLKLTGPALTVETGCSSALVALHLAAQALRHGEIDAALVGGVNLIIVPDCSIGLTHFGGLSARGRCSAFGAEADGFVRGEGVAAVYLKRLDDALAAGDRIRGVIAGTAVNNDGGGESLVTPSPAGQEDLLRRAYGSADIPLDKLAYIEAHGTGTLRGDPIEAGAIGRVLGRARIAAGPLAVGSAKSNIGHLEPAAGMAGLVKVLLALEHRLVPPSLHIDQPNPDIPLDDLNLRLVPEPLVLPYAGDVYAGVNSFGWGGTNAHVIVRSAPESATEDQRACSVDAAPAGPRPVLLGLSGHRQEALRERARQLSTLLGTPDPTASLHGIAHALGRHRDHFGLRLAVTAEDAAQAEAELAGYAEDPTAESPALVTGRALRQGRVAFVFPGQGSQWAGMGRALFASDEVFAATIRRCAAALSAHVDWNLVEMVATDREDWLDRLDLVQPVLWAMSLGLAEVWRAAGVEPDVVIGHSQGEITAATLAGILTIEDAALIMARRSALVARTAGLGRMLAVDLDLDRAREALEGFEDSVSLAVNNGPTSCVLSGDTEAVLMLKELLEADDVYCRLVRVDYASHSPQMDALGPDLLDALAPITPGPGTIELYSTVRGRVMAGTELDAAYWAENLRSPVMFADAMGQLLDDGVTHVVEISPHPVLTPAIEQLAALRPEPARVLSTIRRNQGEPGDLTAALARAYVAGLEPFGAAAHGGGGVALPPYPWQRERFWIPEGRARSGASAGLDPQLVPVPGETGAWHGELDIDTDSLPWLADHRVHGAVVAPGVLHLLLALNTARARTGAMPRTLADVRFLDNLTCAGDPNSAGDTVRAGVGWSDDAAGAGRFTLRSLAPGSAEWTEHTTARVEPGTGLDPVPFPAAFAGEPGDPAAFYAACARRGLDYGPDFQTVTELSTATDEVLGLVRLGDKRRAGARPYGLHPALWDGALQVALGLVGEQGVGEQGVGEQGAVVPTAIGRITVHDALDEPVLAVWSHASRAASGLVDIHVYAEDMRPLLSLTGLVLTPVESAERDEGPERIHRLEFREQEWPSAPATPVGRWLVAGASGRATPLAAAMRELGAEVTSLTQSALASEGAALPADCAGVVFAAPSGDHDAQREGLLTLAALVRAAVAAPCSPRLVVATAGAQSVLAGDVPDPGAALYWGFGRVLIREHPEFSPLLVDGPAVEDWAALAREALAGDGEEQVAIRAGRRFAGRLVRGGSELEPDEEAARRPWRTPPQPFRLQTLRPGADGLAWRPLARTSPAPGFVEVEVTAAALNFLDVMKTMGTYPDPTGRGLLGGECVGRITALGAGVTGLAVGDRVAATAFGALASHAVARAEHVVPVPAGMGDADAAGLPLVLATAWYALGDLGRVGPGDTVLIHSAAGGLGLAAVGVAHALGATVIATAGSADKRLYLRKLGIEHVFDSRDSSWAGQVAEVTGGRGVDLVLNSLTGSAIPLGLDALAEDGRFIEVGKKDIYEGRRITLDAFRKGITLAAVDLAGLMERRPDRYARVLRDAWRLVEDGRVAPLPVSPYPFAQAAEAVRAMAGGRHIGKFVLVDPGTVERIVPDPLPEGRLRPDATYFVSGGLGALGLSLAGFLAERGATSLVLAGRSAPSAQAAASIERLRAKGVDVLTLAVDVADPVALGAALARVRAELPPLRGVVHAAGLLDDATIVNVTAEQADRVLAGKVEGARALDLATRDDPLDLFVLFSSAAGLVGNAGQAVYAAGNTYLDALAESRRAQGLPALAVQWGPFSDIGLAAADDQRGNRLAERGMAGFAAEEAWPVLARLLDEGTERVTGYFPLDLRQWFDAYPDTAASRTWEVLREAEASGSGAPSATGEFLARLRGAAPDARSELALAKVRELAGRVMRLDAAAVEPEAPFKDLGLDSLMSLELRNRLEAAFGLRLSPTLLWTFGSARPLAAELEKLSATASA